MTDAERQPQEGSLHGTQQEAIESAQRVLTGAGGGELVIHGINGQIRDKRTVLPEADSFPVPE